MAELYVDLGLPVHPNGAECADCIHMARCRWLISRKGHEVQCDWEPSKFVAAPKADKVAADGD